MNSAMSKIMYTDVNSNNGQLATGSKGEIDLQTLLLQLKENMSDSENDEFLMPVRRGHVLEDALRSMQRTSFSPKLPLNVSNIYYQH